MAAPLRDPGRRDQRPGLVATEERARSAGFAHVYQGHTEKIPILEEILEKAGLQAEQVGYVGDDFTDVVVMHRVGLGVATANAKPEVKAEAHWVTPNPGGHGALRDVVELLLKAQGRWEEILRHYEIGRGAPVRGWSAQRGPPRRGRQRSRNHQV